MCACADFSLRERDAGLMRKHEEELIGEWPPKDERSALDSAVHLLGFCSEMMLFPPGAITKGSSYADELEKWAAAFPREQLRVLHTDELASPPRAQRPRRVAPREARAGAVLAMR